MVLRVQGGADLQGFFLVDSTVYVDIEGGTQKVCRRIPRPQNTSYANETPNRKGFRKDEDLEGSPFVYLLSFLFDFPCAAGCLMF